MKLNVRIPVHAEWLKKAQDFANASLESRQAKLQRRGQSNTEKIKADIECGVISEYAVWWWALWNFDYCTEPDLTVYTAKKKTWQPDLRVGDIGLHVKTYSNPKWSSWVFTHCPSRRDVDPIIYSPQLTDMFVLTYTNIEEQYVQIKYFCSAFDVRHSYEEPLLPQLKFSKRVLYPATLDKLFTSEADQTSLPCLTQ